MLEEVSYFIASLIGVIAGLIVVVNLMSSTTGGKSLNQASNTVDQLAGNLNTICESSTRKEGQIYLQIPQGTRLKFKTSKKGEPLVLIKGTGTKVQENVEKCKEIRGNTISTTGSYDLQEKIGERGKQTKIVKIGIDFTGV